MIFSFCHSEWQRATNKTPFPAAANKVPMIILMVSLSSTDSSAKIIAARDVRCRSQVEVVHLCNEYYLLKLPLISHHTHQKTSSKDT